MISLPHEARSMVGFQGALGLLWDSIDQRLGMRSRATWSKKESSRVCMPCMQPGLHRYTQAALSAILGCLCMT